MHGLSLDKSAAANNDNEDEPSGVPAEVVQLINICKEIVTLAKRTKISTKLDNTLAMFCNSIAGTALWQQWSPLLKTFKICIQSAQRPGSTATCYTTTGRPQCRFADRRHHCSYAFRHGNQLNWQVTILADYWQVNWQVLPTKLQLSKHLSPLALPWLKEQLHCHNSISSLSDIMFISEGYSVLPFHFELSASQITDIITSIVTN